LYRLESSRTFYALLKRAGKQIRRSAAGCFEFGQTPIISGMKAMMMRYCTSAR
jgi:hypothetical protein